MATFHDHDQHVPQAPTRHIPTTAQRAGQGSTTASGVIALACAGFALASAPLLMLIPYAGFISAFIAGAGAFIAFRSLRSSTERTALATAGLIISVVVFALLAGIATAWNVFVADPAVRDYPDLQEAVRYAIHAIFG